MLQRSMFVLPPRAVLAILMVVAAITWWPSLQAGFIWDDDDYVTRNPLLLTLGGLWRIWTEPSALPQYYPLVHTTFWVEYRLWGLTPLGYHFDNVVLHTAAAWLLFLLGRQLALPVALAPALWFLVHPVHVESVTWVTERKNVLSLVCALLAARGWLRWFDTQSPRAFWWATGAFLCALLSKTVTASLPAALLVVVWWRDGALPARAWRSLLPWFGLGLALAAWTAVLEATHVGAADPRWQLHGAERLLVAGRAPWHYLASLLWPPGVCFQYPRWQLEVGSLAQWSWPAATALALGLAWWSRRRCGRGPLAVLLLFGGTLLPALGCVDVFPFRYSFVADHFQYHANLAVLVGIAAVVVPRLVARWSRRRVAWVGGLWLVANLAIAWPTQFAYRDAETLWRHTLARNPDATLALLNLGGLHSLRGEPAAAKLLLERAVALDPTSHEGWNNLGTLSHRAGDRQAALAHYERALVCKSDDPGTNHNLAVFWLEERQPARALPFAERALALAADYFEGHQTLARALHDCGQWQRALDECDYVLQRVPADLETRARAARCLFRLGRHQHAASNAMVWLRSHPASSEARQLVVETLAHVLRAGPPERAGASAEQGCRNSGIDFAPMATAVQQALRALGATAHAEALRVDR